MDVLLSFNLAAVLDYFYFLFRSLQPNEKSSACRLGLVMLNFCGTYPLKKNFVSSTIILADFPTTWRDVVFYMQTMLYNQSAGVLHDY
jgi:hypothetical protein